MSHTQLKKDASASADPLKKVGELAISFSYRAPATDPIVTGRKGGAHAAVLSAWI